jgi:hypothetical protein
MTKLLLVCLVFLSISATAQTVKIKEYYQLNVGNSWNYVAPPTWKGDYISRMEAGEKEMVSSDRLPTNYTIFDSTINHFDATNAAKILMQVRDDGIYYFGEIFADKTSVRFDKPQLWFPAKVKIGTETKIDTDFTRNLLDGKTNRGTYKLSQKYVSLEDVKVTAGAFKKCLRIESESFWDLGDGRKARTISVYHYAKNVGVVKASARFIIINSEGKETINRLVETDLKAAKVGNKNY